MRSETVNTQNAVGYYNEVTMLLTVWDSETSLATGFRYRNTRRGMPQTMGPAPVWYYTWGNMALI